MDVTVAVTDEEDSTVVDVTTNEDSIEDTIIDEFEGAKRIKAIIL